MDKHEHIVRLVYKKAPLIAMRWTLHSFSGVPTVWFVWELQKTALHLYENTGIVWYKNFASRIAGIIDCEILFLMYEQEEFEW